MPTDGLPAHSSAGQVWGHCLWADARSRIPLCQDAIMARRLLRPQLFWAAAPLSPPKLWGGWGCGGGSGTGQGVFKLCPLLGEWPLLSLGTGPYDSGSLLTSSRMGWAGTWPAVEAASGAVQCLVTGRDRRGNWGGRMLHCSGARWKGQVHTEPFL